MIPYDPVTLPVSLFCLANGAFQLYYALRLKRAYPKEHHLPTSVVTVTLWVVAALAYPFFYTTPSPQVRAFQALSNLVVCGVTPGLVALALLYQHGQVRRHPELRTERAFARFMKAFQGVGDEGDAYPLKTDLSRKLLHLVPAVVIIALWVFATRVWAGAWHQDAAWGLSGEDFGMFLILTIGYSGVFAFAALDYLRLSHVFERHDVYHLIPSNCLHLLCRAMKRRELYNFIKPVALVLAMVPAFFLPFGVFASVALGATIADGAASVFGRAYGRTHWPKGSPKTVVGYVAGGVTQFLLALACCTVFESFPPATVLVLALTGATTFVFIDMLNLSVDDNILNPLFCGLTMGLVLLCL